MTHRCLEVFARRVRRRGAVAHLRQRGGVALGGGEEALRADAAEQLVQDLQ